MVMQDYYLNHFRTDMGLFFAGATVPYFGHAWRHNCRDWVSRIPELRRPEFIICLFFTVLVDQAMHCHFRQVYSRFESLTRYPKFCHGLGQFQFSPYGILDEPHEQNLVDSERLLTLMGEGMRLFVNEVISFFRDHMPEITPQDFFRELIWDRDVQIPELIPLADSKVRDLPGYRAYKALCSAVEAAGIDYRIG